MAVVTTVTKVTNVDAVLRMTNATGAASAVVSLADLALESETAGQTLEVSIDRIYGNTDNDATITVTRNSEVIILAVTSIDPDSDVIRENNTQTTHDITVAFSGAGMVIMRLKKISGYGNKLQPERYSIYDDETTIDA